MSMTRKQAIRSSDRSSVGLWPAILPLHLFVICYLICSSFGAYFTLSAQPDLG